MGVLHCNECANECGDLFEDDARYRNTECTVRDEEWVASFIIAIMRCKNLGMASGTRRVKHKF